MEIERKFLLKEIPQNLEEYPCLIMEQGYLSVDPVVRIRRQNEEYILTYKSRGMLEREEVNLPLTRESYEHLRDKTDGQMIKKIRYLIPYGKYTIELDLFKNPCEGLYLAEVEFPSVEEANLFSPPEWFGKDVTYDENYHNSRMSQL